MNICNVLLKCLDSRRLHLAMGKGNILFKSEIMLRELAMARVKKLVGSHILHAAYLVPSCAILLHDY